MLKEMIRGAGKTCIFFHNSYLSQYVLEGKHPSSKCISHADYKKLSVEWEHQQSGYISVNLFSHGNYDNISSSGNVGSVFESSFDMLFGERGIIFQNLLYSFSSRQHFQDLPDHNPCSFESRSAAADFAVRNNVVVNLNSHEIDNGYSVFKDFVSFEDDLTSVCISNISYYVSNYCSLMPAEVVKIKSKILEIKDELRNLRVSR